MFCQFVDIFVHWNLQQFLVVREERGKLKRKEGEESPHPVQGTQACTWLSCPWSAAWLAQSDLRAVNQTMSLLFVQTPSTSTYIREQVQTGHLTGGTDHQQTWLKTKCQNNLLGIEKCQESSSVFPARGWTTQHHAGSNLQIKTTDKHFNHLSPLLPLILENLTRVQVCSHAPLPPSFSHCLVTHRFIDQSSICISIAIPQYHSLIANRARQVERFSEGSEQDPGPEQGNEGQLPGCLCLHWDAQLAQGCCALSPAVSVLGMCLQMLKKTKKV